MTDKKVALITGITGQDGSYLAELLLKKGTPLMQLVAVKKQPEIKMYDSDSPIKKSVSVLRNWIASKMHTASQYRNMDKLL